MPGNRYCAAEHREYLAAVAVHLLRIRERDYPAAITAEKLTAAEAARKLELMRCVVAQWAWAIDPAFPAVPEPADGTGHYGAFGAHNHLLAAEMDGAAGRARQLAARDPANPAAETFALLVEALAWHQATIDGRARIVAEMDWLHAFNRKARDRRGAGQRLAA